MGRAGLSMLKTLPEIILPGSAGVPPAFYCRRDACAPEYIKMVSYQKFGLDHYFGQCVEGRLG